MKGRIVRPLQLAAVGALLTIVALLWALAWSNRQSVERLESVARSMEHIQALQATGLQMTQLLADDLTGTSTITRGEVAQAATDIRGLLRPNLSLDSQSVKSFEETLRELTTLGHSTRVVTARALGHFRAATHRESGAQSRQLNALLADAREEGRLILTVMMALPVLLLVLFWLSYRRIFSPIDNLRRLLMRVAEGDIRPVATRGVDPLLMPLFQNYNRMAERLLELEEAHRRRAIALEREVRAATGAVLDQQNALARAERLATVGELSASLAHELRNPLAGIRMAMDNISAEASDPVLKERVQLMGAELERMTRLLNGLLAQSRMEPEGRRQLDIGDLIDEVLQLVRYQSPENVALENHSEERILASVPPDGLRQALLNLTINAVQSIGPEGGKVMVLARRVDHGLQVTVSDDGAEFPDALLAGGPRAFLTGRSDGIGLGLSIVRRFAREAGGELRLRNLKPRGAQSELFLPEGSANG